MTQQLAFAGFNAAPTLTDRLLLATLPDSLTAARMAQIAQNLRSEYKLKGRPLTADRFHVTLCHIGDYAGLPAGIVTKVIESVARVTMPSFDVVFDHAKSFGGNGKKPFVLCESGGNAGLKALRQALFMALKMYGPKCQAAAGFTPHVTMLYDDLLMPEHPVEPVSWKVREFVLIHSLLGQTKHIPLARWSLHD